MPWLPGALRPRLSRESHLMAPGVASAATAHPWSPSSTWLLGRFRPAKSPSLWWVTSCSASVWRLSSPLPGPTWAIGALARPVSFGVYGVSAAAMRIVGGRRYDRVPQRPFVAGSPGLWVGPRPDGDRGEHRGHRDGSLAAGMAHGALFPILTSQVVSRARTAERGSAMSIYTLDLRHRPSRVRPAVGL